MLNNFKKYSGVALLTSGIIGLSSCGKEQFKVSNDMITVSECPVSFETDDVKTVMEKPYVLSGTTTNSFVSTTTNSVVSTTTSTGVSTTSVDVSVVDIESVTTSSSLPEMNVVDMEPYYVGLEYSECINMRNKYFYVDSYESYTLNSGEYLEEICENVGTPSVYDILDYIPSELNVGDSFTYPIKCEYYLASPDERISDIAFETGVSESTIRSLNGFPSDIDVLNATYGILLHIFKGNSTSYNTNKGVSNVVNNNKIFADKLVSIGDKGHEQLLGLKNDRFVYGNNSVNYYKFDDNGLYTSRVVCSNVIDISVLDGDLVAYVRDDDVAYKMAKSAGISNPDDFAISQFQTHFNYFYDICFDKFLEPYINCSEGVSFVR